MAEQGVSNERKKELEHIDPFQEKLIQAMAYAKEHKNHLLVAAGALAVVIAVFYATMASFRNAENRASELAARTMVEYEGKKEDPQKAFEAVKDDFQTIFTEFSNTSAGTIARVKFARICYDAGQYDKAFEMYKQAYDDLKGDPALKNFLLASLGNVCLARNDKEKAKSYFLQLEKSDSALSKDQALFALAGLYESENQEDTSRKLYEKLAMGYEKSIYRDMAKAKVDSVP